MHPAGRTIARENLVRGDQSLARIPGTARFQRATGFPGYGVHARRVRSQASLPMDQPRIFTRVPHAPGGCTTAHENVARV